MYSLTLAEDGRILSATFPKYNPHGVIVGKLPEGDITNYICKVDEKTHTYEYIHSPLPKPAPESQTDPTEVRLNQMQQQIDALLDGRTS